jgi:hypothetical protein
MDYSQSDLIEWFDYRPETGEFFWKKRPPRGGTSCRVGDPAGSMQKTPSGSLRRVLFLKGKKIVAARAAYIMVHGSLDPSALVDHINGIPHDDRIENLRIASHVQNAWNKVGRANATLGKGVAKDRKGRFKARITGPDGTKINLGTWDTEAEARAAYLGASAILHGQYSVGNRPAAGKISSIPAIRDAST